MQYSENVIEVVGKIITRQFFGDGNIIRLRLDAGERWDVYAQNFDAERTERIRQEMHSGDVVKIKGFVKFLSYQSRETGELKRMSQVSILDIEKADPHQKYYTRWELEGRLQDHIYAYTGKGIKGKFSLVTTLRNGDKKEYTVMVQDYDLAKRLEQSTEPGQILRVRGTLGKYVVKNDCGERFWRPCMYLTEDLW